jgi:hypothetical protein
LTPELRDQLLHLSQCLPDLWSGPQLRDPQRKALLRSLIACVMVKRTAADRVEGKSIWMSGHFSVGIVIPPVLHQQHVTGDDTMVERTRQWWAEGYSDLHIADVLSREGFRSARRETVLAKTVMKMRHRHHWGSPSPQHRFADKMEEQWTIRGLARELGVASGWVSNRMRNGFLSALAVSRKPPPGNVLIRDDAAVLARLQAEVKRSRRLRRNARTASIPPDAGAANAANCAMTSRTHRTLQGAKSDIEGGDHDAGARTAAKTGHRAVSRWGEHRRDLPRPPLCTKLALHMESALPGRRSGMGQEREHSASAQAESTPSTDATACRRVAANLDAKRQTSER